MAIEWNTPGEEPPPFTLRPVKRKWGCMSWLILFVALYSISMGIKTAGAVREEWGRQPALYRNSGMIVDQCTDVWLFRLESDMRHIEQNVERGDIVGTVMAIVDNLNPFYTAVYPASSNERAK